MEQGDREEPPPKDQHRVSDVRGAARDDQVNDEQKAASAADDQRSTNPSKTYFGHVCSADAAVVLVLWRRVCGRGIATVIAMVTHLHPEVPSHTGSGMPRLVDTWPGLIRHRLARA